MTDQAPEPDPKRTVRITLEISYDPTEYDHPGDWTWPVLLDLSDPDDVRVVDTAEVQRDR